MFRVAFWLLAFIAVDVHAQTAAPILQPGRLWAFEGFAITPPTEDWASLQKSRTRAIFVKKPRANGTAAVASVVAQAHDSDFSTREAFLAHARTQRGLQLDGKRYQLLRHDEALETGPVWCTRYSLLGADQASFLSAAWFVEVFGRTCWHAQARLIIDLNVSERGLAGDQDELRDLASEVFLSSLMLRPVGRPSSDLDALLRQAENGNLQAALYLAAMYSEGRGIPADPVQAERWYRYAAEAGEVDAQYNLGLFYLQAGAARETLEQGLLWLVRAADQRDAQAQYNLGLIFYQGKLLPVDFERAYDWLALAAANGHEKARDLLKTKKDEPPTQ